MRFIYNMRKLEEEHIFWSFFGIICEKKHENFDAMLKKKI